MAKIELPPPVNVLLAYAANGWAAEQKQFSPAGKPRSPDRTVWLSVVRALLQTPDGLNRLRDLAIAGMAAWKVDPSIIACVAPAFATPDFAARLAWRLGMSEYKEPRPPAVAPASMSGPVPAPVPLVVPERAPSKPLKR